MEEVGGFAGAAVHRLLPQGEDVVGVRAKLQHRGATVVTKLQALALKGVLRKEDVDVRHCKRSALSFAEHRPGYDLRIELFTD